MGNAYLSKLNDAKKQAYTDGVWEGLQLGVNLCAIADNRVHGHGEKRLSETEAYVQKLVDEMIDTNDPLANKVHLEQAVRQIRGKAWRD